MINRKTKVSICIPTYKQTFYLKRNLDSIVIQDFKDYEIIITDDTPDDTVELFVKEYSNIFEGKLRYYRNKIALGSPNNWNYAVSLSESEYVKILHHDDWFTRKESLRLFVEAIEKEKVDFVFSSTIVKSADWEKPHQISKSQLIELKNDPCSLFFGNVIGAPSVTLIRRSSILAFDPMIKWLVDVDFYIRILLKVNDFYFLKEPLIATLSDGLHQITRECEFDAETQVYENYYLYKKIGFHIKEKDKAIEQLKQILKNYNIKSIRELKDYGVVGSMIPSSIWLYFIFKPLNFVKTEIRTFLSIVYHTILSRKKTN